MHLSLLLAAVERGDDPAVFELLDDVTADELAGDDRVTLLAAAAHAGRSEVVDWLVVLGVDVTRPWAGGVDPVTWAAEGGKYWVLSALLPHSQDPLSPDSPHRRALRAARAAIGSEAGTRTGPPPAHRGIVTTLEDVLGIRRSPDELMARALVHADPRHDDWLAPLFLLGRRADQETFDWARKVAEDTSSPSRRYFGLDTVHSLGFEVGYGSEMPFTREAVEFLRPLLDTERDPDVLATVIAAYTNYCLPEEAPAVLVHARHTHPAVRGSVALNLSIDAGTGPAEQQEVAAAFLRLAADPVPGTRASALYKFTLVPVDSPELRAVMAAHLADPHLDVRLEAAAGLALRGDERGLTVLDEIGHGIKHFRSHGTARLDMVRDMLRVRTASDDQGR
ncbi:hypothetical protein [Streptomyces sp. CB03911]|uniref:hypothetical protein n=1 Tax=Streptomyces sp. CB03911 TaxID=1804758 RepID=UPI0018FE529B|nr:hypothetical protein [Streptomyces sp. CB03911]